ncbi:MAG: hypothetical protein JW793_15490 [Acidobacteria bacterium]|nr:hypothetical protein [Acidobacteriota bacterium]
MKQVFAALLLILSASTFAAADGYVKTRSHTDPISMMGQNQPARDTVTEQWIGDGRVATVTEDTTTIVDVENKVLYIINHRDKTYVSANLPLDFSQLVPPQMAEMIQNMKVTFTVTPTGQKKTIGSRSCDGYDVDLNMVMMPMKMKMYATSDVPFDYRNYMKNFYSTLVKTQMIGIDEASIGELGKIDGFVISQEMTGDMMGAKIRQNSEVVEIAEKPAPAGIYSVPDGYTRKGTLTMEELQSQQGR